MGKPRGGTAGGGKRNGVQWAKPAEPSFIRQIKAQTGYKESAGIDAKRENLPTGPDEDQEELDDERWVNLFLNIIRYVPRR